MEMIRAVVAYLVGGLFVVYSPSMVNFQAQVLETSDLLALPVSIELPPPCQQGESSLSQRRLIDCPDEMEAFMGPVSFSHA